MFRLFLVLLWALPAAAQLATPEWIWGDRATDQETRYFRKTFNAPTNVVRLGIVLAADNQAELKIDQRHEIKNNLWDQPTRTALPGRFEPGPHTLEIKARNAAGPAGLLLRLEVNKSDGTREVVVTDATWETSSDGQTWVPAKSLGPVGIPPWGKIALGPAAIPAESLTTLPDFKVELVYSAELGDGSWVALTSDPQGRLIVSPQGAEPLRRITLDATGRIARMETIDLPIRGAMGLAHAFGALYVNGQGPQGYHLYRVTDSNNDDRYDKVELIRRWRMQGKDGGLGEHGVHAIVPGPDQHLYIVNGNYVEVPTDLAPTSPFRNYAVDRVLPVLSDGNRTPVALKPPEGYILRVTPDGQNAELFLGGLRNTYDLAFNRDGELFGFDSDAEADWGLPWYRPNRLFHAVNAGELGFREGSGKWPEYYPDSLPAVVNAGLGSPTGLVNGSRARFPAKYQRALYGLDWSFGRILVFHLDPRGASYTGTMETLLRGRTLNVTDAEFGPDGALYFITGGRGIQSGLYRVSYTGKESTEPQTVEIALFTPEMAARAERKRLEQFHNLTNPGKITDLWPALSSPDRHLRYAARVALEVLPAADWKDRALNETNVTAGLTALLGLARVGSKDDQPAVLQALARWPLTSLTDEEFLNKLRVIEVSFARHGIPDALRARALEKLSAQFPSPSVDKNRELVQLLVALDSPDVVPRALALRDAAPTQEEQMTYQVALRLARSGWTPELRQQYFAWFGRPGEDPGARRSQVLSEPMIKWFAEVGLKPVNGASFDNFLRIARQEAFQAVPDADKAPLAALIARQRPPVRNARFREKVKEWSVAELTPALGQLARGRNFEQGETVFRESQCIACHRFGGEGGASGPDLTGVGTRYSAADLLKSLIEPSAVISDQFQAHVLTLKNGDTVVGRITGETPDTLEVVVNPLTTKSVRLLKVDVQDRTPSPVSPMPEDLLNTFSQAEILDLLAYLQSNGDPQAAAFRP